MFIFLLLSLSGALEKLIFVDHPTDHSDGADHHDLCEREEEGGQQSPVDLMFGIDPSLYAVMPLSERFSPTTLSIVLVIVADVRVRRVNISARQLGNRCRKYDGDFSLQSHMPFYAFFNFCSICTS